MGGAYGIELRRRIVEAYDNKEGSVRELAERFAVAPNTVQNYLNLRNRTGSLAPRAHGGGTAPLLDTRGLEQVRRLHQEAPDATEVELAGRYARRHKIKISRQTVGRALRRLGLTRKKNSARNRARHRARADGSTELRADGFQMPSRGLGLHR